MFGFAGKIDTNAVASKLYLAYQFSLFQASVRQRRSCDAKWREEGKSRRKEDDRGTPLAPPGFFSYKLFFALSPLSWNRQALLVSGDQITSNRRSKRARSGNVLCNTFILNGNQKEFWLYRCYACVIVTRRLVLRDLQSPAINQLAKTDVSPRSSPLRDVSQEGTSATHRQKFHTDDVKSVRNTVISADWTTEQLHCFSYCLRMTDKRQKATKVKCKRDESITKQVIFVEQILLQKKHLIFVLVRSQMITTLHQNRPGEA